MPDFKANRFKFSSHLVIPKPKRFDASRGEIAFALFIALLPIGESVSASVELDHELGFHTEEIEEVIAARILTAEFEFAKTPVAQETPETLFGVGGLPAESTGEISGGGGSRAPHTPHLDPLPSEGRGDARVALAM